MATRKRATASKPSSSNAKKRRVTVNTCKKWQSSFEHEYQTLSWLRYDVDKHDRDLVNTLWCDACRANEDKIVGMKNYSSAWMAGSLNHKTSNVVDHATSEQHKAAMIHVQRSANEPITNYSPIARSLLVMDKSF